MTSRRARTSLVRLAAALLLVVLAGCADKSEPGKRKIKRDPNLLVVYAACALAPTVDSARTTFLAQNSGKLVDVVVDEPEKLAGKIRSGEVPDIVVCPGDAEIGALENDGLLDSTSRQAFGDLHLVIMVPKGNPGQIHRPEDLLDPKVRTVAVSTPGLTSPGSDAKREMDRLKLWSKLQDKLSYSESPSAAMKAVSQSKADAALLYDLCLWVMPPESGVEPACTLTPDGERGMRIYAVVHKQSPNALLAQRFLRALVAAPAPVKADAAEPSPTGGTGQ